MRIPEPDEDLIGKVCVCSVGRPAVVVGKRTFSWGMSWVGLGLDGKGVWASTQPCVIAENGAEFHDKLIDRFHGRLGG